MGLLRILAAAVLAFGIAGCARAADPAWVGAWAAGQQVPEPQNALPAQDLTDATLRQVVRVSLGGPRLRLRISNAFGTAPLVVDAVHVARAVTPGSSRIDPASDRAVLFSGRAAVVIPAGADYVSDPVALPVAAFDRLAVSLHLPRAPEGQTSHPGSRATSFLVHGSAVSAPELSSAKTVEHWFNLSAVEVLAPAGARAVVVLGDSISDGHGATTDGDDRWPDHLARRLQGRNISLINQGVGGNRLLLDGNGPNALARLDRDVLAQPGARWLIVLEGSNDLGMLTRDAPVPPEAHTHLIASIISAYEQIVARAHTKGIKVYGATILPFGASDYYHPGALGEADRQAVNAWIRGPGHFDAVIDLDAAIRDPARPERMAAAYDRDGLHPSPAGYRAMADAVPLSLFGP